MTKKKKIILIITIPLASIMVLIAVALTVLYFILPSEIKYMGAVKLAKRKYGMDEAIFCTYGEGETLLSPQPAARFVNYVFGYKDGEEVILVVPSRKFQEPYFTQWVFDKSFSEVVTAIEESCGHAIPKNENGLYEDSYLKFSDAGKNQDYGYNVPNNQELDVPFVVMYFDYSSTENDGTDVINRYTVGQSNGELVFFTEEVSRY